MFKPKPRPDLPKREATACLALIGRRGLQCGHCRLNGAALKLSRASTVLRGSRLASTTSPVGVNRSQVLLLTLSNTTKYRRSTTCSVRLFLEYADCFERDGRRSAHAHRCLQPAAAREPCSCDRIRTVCPCLITVAVLLSPSSEVCLVAWFS